MTKYFYSILILFSFLDTFTQINSEHLQAKLDSFFLSVNEKEPGGSVYIEQGNQILYSRSFGLADVKTQEKYTENTVSNIASVSKTFIAYSILILDNKNKLSLQDSIIDFFPDLKNNEYANKLKIKDLLDHLKDFEEGHLTKKDSLFFLTANDKDNFELFFRQKNNLIHSDLAFSALVLIIEKVSQMKWQDFIQKNIFDPAGMVHSKFTDSKNPKEGIAHSYKKFGKNFVEFDRHEAPKMELAGNAGIWSSIVDLKKYVNGIKDCLFLDCARLKYIQEHQLYDGNDPIIGEKSILIESTGFTGGFRSYILYLASKDLTVIWMSNNSTNYTKPILTSLMKLGFL